MPAVPQSGYLGKRVAQMGRGYDHRLYNRAYPFELPPQPQQEGVGSLTVSTISGAILGTIRTDILRSQISAIKWTRDRNGCADAVLSLATAPDFEILPFARANFRVDGLDAYSGVVTNPPELPTTEAAALQYKIFSARSWLEQLQPIAGQFDAGTDITEIVRSLVQEIGTRAPIKYDESKIDEAVGNALAADIDIRQKSLKAVFDFLAGLSQTAEYYYTWSVDETSTFRWKRFYRAHPEKTFFVGYDLYDFKPQKNFESIKNTISIHRDAVPESGDSGFGVVGIFNDETSVKKYARRELVQKIPGYVADTDGEAYGRALLTDLAEPKYAAQGKSLFRTGADLLPEGAPVRVIMPFGVYRDNVSPLDKAQVDDPYAPHVFQIFGAGDLSINVDPSIFVYANGAIRFDFESAAGQVAVLEVDSNVPVQKLYLYARATRKGAIVRVGCGASAWDERTATVSLKTAGEFYPIEINFENDILFGGIKFFGVEILDDEAGPQSVWIDKLDADFIGNKTYLLTLEQAVYSLDAGEVSLRFGQPAASLVDYVTALQTLVNDMQRANVIQDF